MLYLTLNEDQIRNLLTPYEELMSQDAPDYELYSVTSDCRINSKMRVTVNLFNCNVSPDLAIECADTGYVITARCSAFERAYMDVKKDWEKFYSPNN